jgi:hypothetical protein
MTIEPNMFQPTALAGKAQVIPDPGNTFIAGVAAALGAIVPLAATGTQNAAALVHFDIAFPNTGATQTFTVTTPDKIEIVDVIVRKSVAGAGNTITVKDGAANAISDAIAAAVDKTITRMGTNDPAFNTIAAGATFTVVNTFAAGSNLCNVTVVARRV